MTTLASAVAIGDNALSVNAPMTAARFPGFVQIDSEFLKVGGQEYKAGTTLVLSEPAQAAHNSGATVTYAGRAFDPTFVSALGAGGGAAEAGTVVEQLTGTQTTYGQLFRGDEELTDPAPAEGDMWIDTTGGVPYQLKFYNGATWDLMPLVAKDALGVEVSAVRVSPDGNEIALVAGDMSFTFTLGSGAIALTLDADTSIALLQNGTIGLTALAGDIIFDAGANDIFAGALTITGAGTATLGGQPIGTQAAAVADVVGADPADIATTLNALLAALRASNELAT